MKDSSISITVSSAERDMQEKAAYVFKCGDHYYARYWRHSVTAENTDIKENTGWLDCGPGEPVSVATDGNNSEARSSAFSYVLSAIIAAGITVIFMVPKFIKWGLLIVWRIIKGAVRLPGLLLRWPKSKNDADTMEQRDV